MEENNIETTTTEVTTTEYVNAVPGDKTVNDLYLQNIDITYLLMGVVALLIIELIIRRK